jgi:hypothetical protein
LLLGWLASWLAGWNSSSQEKVWLALAVMVVVLVAAAGKSGAGYRARCTSTLLVLACRTPAAELLPCSACLVLACAPCLLQLI